MFRLPIIRVIVARRCLPRRENFPVNLATVFDLVTSPYQWNVNESGVC